MYELSQDWTRCVAPNHGAWLAQSHAKTAHSSDLELASNESFQLDAPGDEIPAVLVGREGRVEGLAYLGLDQSQRASGEARGEGASPRHMPVTLQA